MCVEAPPREAQERGTTARRIGAVAAARGPRHDSAEGGSRLDPPWAAAGRARGGIARIRARAPLLLDALVLLAAAPAFATRLAPGMGVVEGLPCASVQTITLAVPALIRRRVSVRAVGAILRGVCRSRNLIVTLAGDGIFSGTLVWSVAPLPVSALLCGESSAVSGRVEVSTLRVSEGLLLLAHTAAEQIVGTPGVALHGREAFDALPPRVSAHLPVTRWV